MRKWDGYPTYRFEADPLGRDEYGTWLGLPTPTPYKGPKGPGTWKHSSVILVPETEWWIASFNDERDPKGVELYIDVTTASEWVAESLFRTIDLDLDVVRYFDGRLKLKDTDEFEERRVKLGYPDHVVRRAREEAESLMQAVEARQEPFDGVGRRWLEKLG